jgi:hypothetical protein
MLWAFRADAWVDYVIGLDHELVTQKYKGYFTKVDDDENRRNWWF